MSQGSLAIVGTWRIRMPRTLRSSRQFRSRGGRLICARCAWPLLISREAQLYQYNRSRLLDRMRGPGGDLIIGMGVDIAEVERIQGAIERHGEVFLKRIYTPSEREYCERFKNKYERYAGRFAAKEAAMKALGTGWRRGGRWVDLEVVRETSGRPTLAVTGEAATIATHIAVKRLPLCITPPVTHTLLP